MEAFAKSVELAEKVPNYRFTMEHALYVREYLRRHPDKLRTVKKLMKAGIIETGTFYTGPWELTSGGEGLVRQLYLGKRWLKEHLGVEPVTVWNVDLPGHTAQMPQILHKAGIRGLVISAGATDNTFQAPYLLHETRGPFLFRWQAPDGSTVMTWSTPWGYSAGMALGLRNETLDAAASSMPTFLRTSRGIATPISCLRSLSSPMAPTWKAQRRVGENIAKWNAEKRFPPLVYASSTELFAPWSGAAADLRGRNAFLLGHAATIGNECLVADRRLEGRLLAAEKFSPSPASFRPDWLIPASSSTKSGKTGSIVVEHNWGGNNGEISDRVKTEKIREACAINDNLLGSALRSLSGAIQFRRPDALRVVVFNPLSWDRKDIVTCTLPVAEEKAGKLVLADTAGRNIPHQWVRGDPAAAGERGGQVAFCAEVPSLGYATYYATTDNPFVPRG